MFEESRTWHRIQGEPERGIRIHLGYGPGIEVDEQGERRGLRWAIVAAVALHLVLFLVRLPFAPSIPDWKAPERAVFAVRTLRFTPPQPQSEQVLPKPQRAVKKIPIPDPTPDDPEPILREDLTFDVPELDLGETGIDEFFIAEGPPTSASGIRAERLGGDIVPPVKLSGETPGYTEEARQGRVQGVVILEAIIDIVGNVAEVKVLKGLPMGLTETAVAAAERWKFRPAMRNGAPVPVFYNLTVKFSLQ
jgi:periplasmic protein TonB